MCDQKVRAALCIFCIATTIGCGSASRTELKRGDFATPTRTVEIFIEAAQNRDAAKLSECIAPDAAGEFAALRERTATPESLEALSKMFEGAQILTDDAGTGQMNGPSSGVNETATVRVKLNDGEESISLTNTESGWKIVDF